MKRHHRPARALSLLCALAIFVSLFPAALAANETNDTQKTALETALENAVVQDTVTPAGIQINLFDYWINARNADSGASATTNAGINKDHYLRFTTSRAGVINAYTGTAAPCTNIVKNRLNGGYPVLTAGKSTGVSSLNNGQTKEESLAYLFDQSDADSGTAGKKTFWDVGGLLQIDDDGYYYYNADQNKVRTEQNPTGTYQSANYAYFNETGENANSFTVYDTWGIMKAGSGNQQGQFFPFTDPSKVSVFTVDDNGKLTANTSTNSNSNGVLHFFGVSMTTRFIQRYGGKTTQTNGKNMTFEFSGDDDVWIFIDGVLVADLGGIHDQASTTINFATGAITINGKPDGTLKDKIAPDSTDTKAWTGDTFADNTYHTLKLFYLERGGTDSNLAMKFNLAYVPETDGIKVDQYNKPLSGVQFDLCAATYNNGTYGIDPDKGTDGLLGSGTTDEEGRFVLTNADDIAVSLKELTDKHKIDYLILKENTEGRKGYRHDDNIYLKLLSNGEVSILFNDMDHRWTTGTYAGLKGTIATNESVQLIGADRKPLQFGNSLTNSDGETLIGTDGKAHLAAGGTLFAVIMRRLTGVGKNEPADADEWGVVTGSALSGWHVYGRGSGPYGYREAVIQALTEGAVGNKNAVAFTLTTNGAYMAELNNCPGDLREYYYWTGNASNKDLTEQDRENSAYAVAFFYTTDISNPTLDNTFAVDGSKFERQFAATIYIPNVKHELNVQKLGDDGLAVKGAKFSLYEANNDGTYNKNATAYDTVTTGADGKAQFPSAQKGVLAAGQYYLVEDSAPAGYKVNTTPVPILVDDERGVMADAGTKGDGVTVTVSEGHLVPTMTPFATCDDIDRTLTDLISTRMEGTTGTDGKPVFTASTSTVTLTLDKTRFGQDGSLHYVPRSTENPSRAWSTDTGWLWFSIKQDTNTYENSAAQKIDLSDRDLTRLFTGETTVIVTNQRVGSLSVTKEVENATKETGTSQDPNPSSYKIKITLKDKDNKALSGTFGNTTITSGEYVWETSGGTLTLSDLPIGTQWEVEEEALPTTNWETTVTNNNGVPTPGRTASGEIKDANQNDTVTITNRYDDYSNYHNAELTIPVSKSYTSEVYGGAVSFTLTSDSDNPAGDPLTEAKTVSITVTNGQSATVNFDTLTFKTVGEYKYTVREVNGGVNGMTYDPTVYTATVTVERDTEHSCLKATVVWSNSANTGTSAPSFSNTYVEPKGSLSIKKTVVTAEGSAQPDANQTFPIQITLNYTGTVQVTSTNNARGFTWNVTSGEVVPYLISANETLTLTNLPVGTTWTVTESALTNPERWSAKVNDVAGTSANGTISTTPSNVNITNTYDYATNPAKVEATINVSKSYEEGEGKAAYSGDVNFTITPASNNPDGVTASRTISITGANKESFALTFTKAGTYTYTISEVSDSTVTNMTYDPTVYTVTFEVTRQGNQLVATPTYTVVEKPGDASKPYPYTDTTGLLFTNTYKPSGEGQEKGSLTIHKTLVKPDNVTGLPASYEIEIKLDDGTYSGNVSCTSEIGGRVVDSFTLTFAAGSSITHSIQAGETLTLNDLPVGTQWTVTETANLDSKYWSTKVNDVVDSTSATGRITKEGSSVEIVNTYTPGTQDPGTGSLSITKTVGEGVTEKNFQFKVSISGLTGQYGGATFDNGEALITVTVGTPFVISGLPAGTSYTVTELNADNYSVSYQGNEGSIPENGMATCKVTNELKGSSGEEDPKTASLTITKTVGDGIDTSLSFNFSVTLTYPNNTTEARTITVKANSSETISGLPAGTLYAVTETTTGYTVTASNASGTIPMGGITAAFHNALTGGGENPGPGPNPGGDDGGTPALNRRDHYAYIIGYPDGDVHPQGNITRAEVATIFFRLLRDPVRTQYWSQTNDYPDVAFNKWYNNAISTLTNMGIICGYPDGAFRPDAPITRAELTKIAASFFSDPRVATTYDGRFSDVQGAEWYISYLMTAIEEGLIEGYPDGSFRPDRPITRAETCTIVNRTLGRKPEKDHLLPESVMINWPDNLDRNVWYYAQMQEATNSHDYRWTSVYSEVCEQWTAKLIERDWAALERTWSHANSAPGGEVMQ